MAEDEKILRIEATINEGKPSSGSPSTPQPAKPSLQESLSEFDASKLEKDSGREEEIDRILKALEAGDETPLGVEEDWVAELNKFVGGEKPLPIDSNEDGSSFTASLLAFLQTQGQGQTAANAGNVLAPLVNAGGGGGAIIPPGAQGAAEVGAAGAGAAVEVGAVASLLSGAGLLAAEFVALTGVLVVAEQLIDATFRGMAQGWEDISARIQIAQAESEISLLKERFRTEETASQASAEVIQARTDLYKSLIDLSATVMQIIAPLLAAMMEILSAIAWTVSTVLKVLYKILEYGTGIFIVIRAIAAGVKWIKDKIMGDSDQDQDFTRDIAKVFADPSAASNGVTPFAMPMPPAQANLPGRYYNP